MIRIGYHANPNSIALCKSTENGSHTAGFILSGFGTCPAPGEICDNAVERSVNFAAHYLQKAFDALFKNNPTIEQASSYLRHQIEQINTNIGYINRYIGQGTYLAGAICYFSNEKYICLSFGGCKTYIWDQANLTPVGSIDHIDPYIRDALGAAPKWTSCFSNGTLPVGAQMICTTEEIYPSLIAPIMENLSAIEPQFVINELTENIVTGDLPLALLDFARFPDLGKEYSE